LPRRGRAGRQLSQMTARQDYLLTDRGRFPGDDVERVATSIDATPEFLYPEIATAVGAALEEGFGIVAREPYHLIVAHHASDSGRALPVKIDDFLSTCERATAAFNLRPWDEFWWVTK